MAEMFIDDVMFAACLDAEADAIRAKTGGSADIPFDYANNKGFADAIAAIPSGGDPWTEVVIAQSYGSGTALKQLFNSLGFSSYLAVRVDNDPGNSEVSYFMYGQAYFLSHDGIQILAYNIRRHRAGDYGAASLEGSITLPIGSKFKVMEVAFGE